MQTEDKSMQEKPDYINPEDGTDQSGVSAPNKEIRQYAEKRIFISPDWVEEFDKKFKDERDHTELQYNLNSLKSFIQSLLDQRTQEIIEEIQEVVFENMNGQMIEEVAEKFQVPDSVAAVRVFDIKLEELKDKHGIK